MAAHASRPQAARGRRSVRGALAAQRVRAAQRAGAAAGRAAAAGRRPLWKLPQRRLRARAGVLSVDVRAGPGTSGHQQRCRQRLERVRPRLLQLPHPSPLADRRVQEAAASRAAGVLDDGPAARPAWARRVERRRLPLRPLPALAAKGCGLEARGVPLPPSGAAGVLPAQRQPAGAPLGLGRRGAGARPLCPRLPRPARPRPPPAPGTGVGAHCHGAPAGGGDGGARGHPRGPGGPGDGCARRPHPREAPLDARQKGASMKPAQAAWLFVAPALLAIALFFVVPVAAALVMSGTDFDIYALADLRNVRFVGLDNYVQLLRRPLFWQALLNTLFFVVVGVPLSVAVSLLAALLLNSPLARFKGLYRTALFVPVVATLAAVAVTWRFLLHTRYGLLNYGLSSLGFSPIDWLGDPRDHAALGVEELRLQHDHPARGPAGDSGRAVRSRAPGRRRAVGCAPPHHPSGAGADAAHGQHPHHGGPFPALCRALRDDPGRPGAAHGHRAVSNVRRGLQVVEPGHRVGGGLRALPVHVRVHGPPSPGGAALGDGMRARLGFLGVNAALALLAALTLFPLAWMVCASLMGPGA